MRSCENIQEIVKEYLTLDIANSAIMIDGEWGSGKTYFIRNKLRPYIEKDLGQKCIYISLNGVSDRDNISKEIFLSSVNFSKKNIPNWLKIAKNYGFEVSKILFEKMSITDKSVNYINIARLEKCVLIFDDLERCLIDIREVLGYINRFVELENVPTIIVANENEIDSRILYYNRELKYLLATSDKIDFPNNDKSEANAIIKDNSNNSNKLSLSNLENRTEHLFGSENDYDHIKEKLVSKTISFVPDLDEIIDVIIENYTLSEVEKKVVTLCKNDIIHYFTKENHYNIRTLEFVFANYDKICKAIKSYDYSDDEKSECLSKIILYITAFSIRYKKGLYIA